MKKYLYKKWVRILSGILCILSFNIAAASFAGIVCMEEMEVFNRTKEDFMQEMNQEVCREYSIRAAADYKDDFDMEEWANGSFRYGVIQSDHINGMDLNDRSIYKVCNFDEDKVIDRKELGESLTVYSCDIGEDTYIYLGNSIFDQSRIENRSFSDSAAEKTYLVNSVYYTSDTGHFYYLTEGDDGGIRIYRVQNELGETPDGKNVGDYLGYHPTEAVTGTGEGSFVSEDTAKDSVVSEEAAEDTAEEGAEFQEAPDEEMIESGGYYWTDNVRMRIDGEGNERYLSDISIISYPKLAKMGTMMPYDEGDEGYLPYFYADGVITEWYDNDTEKSSYFVISYPGGFNGYYTNSPIALLMHWDEMNYFNQARCLIDVVYKYRYSVYGIFLFMLGFFAVSLGCFVVGAGHKYGTKEVVPGYLQKIPFDILTAITAVVEFLLMCVAVGILAEAGFVSRFILCFCVPSLLAAEIIGLLFVQDFAVRLKLRICLKSTFCYKAWGWLKKKCRRCMEVFARTLPFLWKAWLVMFVLAFLEFVGIMTFAYMDVEPALLLWFLEKAVVYPFLAVCLIQMDKLQKGAKRLAAGEINSRIDTKKMFLELKNHGENLNKIQEGIGNAVEQRMKSERFKTELITNVSHDIKTPLTSIINYVDLLEKEDIQNEKVREYLEVLSRQSSRLKKLIEDLMEASKASTGNLDLSLESCNARILVIQTMGEFQEKLSGSRIDLIVQGSEEDISILADTRHLYRVFENLMNNICKYALESTRAYVNVERQGMECVIIFRNISKYPLNIGSDELVERFVRGDSSRNTEGSGLGLSIAKSLTELMYGKFELVIDGDLFKVVLRFPVIKSEEDTGEFTK